LANGGCAKIERKLPQSGEVRLKVSYGLDLPVLLVSLFDRHNFVNQYHVGIGVVKQGIFQRYVHAPTGFAGMESLDIPCRIRTNG